MAINYIPDLAVKPLVEHINQEVLRKSAEKAAKLLGSFPELHVWNVQQKIVIKNNAWYVGFKEQSAYLINLTLIPATVNVEFRYPQYLDQAFRSKLKMQGTTWMYAHLGKHGEEAVIQMIRDYTKNIREDFFAGKVKPGGKSVAEKIIRQLLESLFTQIEIISNRRPDNLRSPKTNHPLELDIFIPALKLAIEVQGPQHFKGKQLYGENTALLENDTFKRIWCAQQGIKMLWMNWESIAKEFMRKSREEQTSHLREMLHSFLTSPHFFMFWQDMRTQVFE